MLKDISSSLKNVPGNLKSIPGQLDHLKGKLNELPGNPLKFASSNVWFVKSKNGKINLVAVKRAALGKSQLETAVHELLDGPNSSESADGLGSEIPRGTLLLGVAERNDEVELNLSQRFATEGGIDSFQTRLEQLSRTVSSACRKPVYLDVEGKRLNMTQGEGIEVHQPINK